ncbi:hypothetical protein CHL76_09500 [Marinococcus halophilus]|uniref:DUF2357 domain-containing protein n=1 Tax=Marinococcus halophilus TaxID=1371 RepID=A0A510Y4T2_MARHA|nr:DUF2357 domain-containing protein [Marinococcus halophilus]OZT79931.1 hypothetical protein CHL76_09500 [Marinococcus halophilus]GEK58153.1 hypothetical protein MHA01_10580 [Marinococcus halophilus]
MAIHCNGEKIPITLYFQDNFFNKYIVDQLWKKEEEIDFSAIPVLKENARIAYCFKKDDVEDEHHAQVKINTSRYTESDELEVIQKGATTDKDFLCQIYSGGDQEEFPWRMGVYFLEVNYKGKIYKGGIYVLPLHLDKNQVESVHQYLDQQVKDIIYDFVFSNQSLLREESADLPQYWYYDYTRYLKKHYANFSYSITKILKLPHNQIVTNYSPSLNAMKMDHRSIRWANTTKGLAKNASSTQQPYYLNKRKKLEYNTKYNQWLNHILLSWKNDINEVERLVNNDYKQVQKKLKSIEEDIIQYKQRIKSLESRQDAGENAKRDVKSKEKMAQKDLRQAKSQSQNLMDFLNVLKRWKYRINYSLRTPLLEQVERTFRKPILKKRTYVAIDQIFHNAKKLKKEDGEVKTFSPILKQTWQIYEYFCLFKALNILEKQGYTTVQGLDENILNVYLEDRIPEGTQFILRKNNREIHVWYDHYHANSVEEANENDELFYTLNSKKKPDIKIDFFEKEHDKLTLRHCVVLDAKFSKFHNIFKKNYVNKTTEQLASYYSFFYNGTERRGTCVDQVVCLYAGVGVKDVQIEKQPITYLKFFPQEEDFSQTIGENELNQLLREYL